MVIKVSRRHTWQPQAARRGIRGKRQQETLDLDPIAHSDCTYREDEVRTRWGSSAHAPAWSAHLRDAVHHREWNWDARAPQRRTNKPFCAASDTDIL